MLFKPFRKFDDFHPFGGGGQSFGPLSPIDGVLPVLWLEADRIIGLSDGDPIATWLDASQGGNNATQAVAGKRPTYKTNIINGKPVARFDGGDCLITSSVDLSAIDDVTIFAIFTAATGATVQAIIEHGNGASGATKPISLFRNSSADSVIALLIGNVGTANYINSIPVSSTPVIAQAIYDKGLATDEVSLYINNVLVGSRSVNNNNTDSFANNVFYIGARTDSTLYLTGDVAFLAVYPKAIAQADIGEMIRYLAKYGLIPVSASDFADNGYTSEVARTGGGTFVQTNDGARLVYQTDAETLYLESYNDIYGTYPGFSDLGCRVNGVDLGAIEPGAAGIRNNTVNLGAGAGKTVEIINGLQSKPAALIGSYACRAVFNKRAYLVGDVSTPRIVMYGDSIIVGANCSNPSLQGVCQLVRNAYSGSLVIEGWGYRSLHDDANTAGLRAAFVAQVASLSPSIIWLAIGTNDYGLNKWSAANFGTAYAAVLDDLHTALPSATIYCQTPIERTSEVANTFGDTLGAYRTQIGTAQSTRGPWAVLVDGTAAGYPQAPGDLADGVHPTTAGHALYGSAVIAELGL